MNLNTQQFLRPQKNKKQELFFEEMKEITPTFKLISNGLVLPSSRNAVWKPEHSSGGVYTENGEFVLVSGFPETNVEKQSIIEAEDNATAVSLCDQKVVYCGLFIQQWGHFLMDSCSRLWYILKDDNTIDAYIWICGKDEDIQLNGNYLELVSLLGIKDRIRFVSRPTRFREIVIPEPGVWKSHFWSRQFSQVFDLALSMARKKTEDKFFDNTGEKIFLTRSRWGRNDLGVKSIDKFFEYNGYSVVHPEELSLSELIRRMSKASIIASISGSTAHNFLFAPRNSKCIIIEKTCLVNDYQSSINKCRELEVSHIDANISLLPVQPGGGPFILLYNKYLDDFAHQNGLNRMPLRTGIVLTFMIRKYLALWFDTYSNYPERWVACDNYELIQESYDETMKTYGFYAMKISWLKILKFNLMRLLRSIFHSR